jgi:DNA adenine methylase
VSGPPLKIAQDAPFPWFGGKRRVAPIVWQALGDVSGYVEPFAGSLAVLLRRPGGASGVETVNDRDSFLANFWRAVQHAPDEVARYADAPVNETDLFARHLWLVNTGRERIAALESDPDHFDAKVAGWWVWGVCAWIGSGWCSGKGPWQLPHLGDPGQGVNRKLPHLGDPGRGYVRTEAVYEWMQGLSERLRRVRVACGDWSRVVTPSVLRAGAYPCGVFLDPPYDAGNENYSTAERGVAAAAREWALAHGDDPRLRVILCGYEGETVMPESWHCHGYSATGAYCGKGTAANEGRHRERLWLSPHCLPMDLYHAAGKGSGLFDEEARDTNHPALERARRKSQEPTP